MIKGTLPTYTINLDAYNELLTNYSLRVKMPFIDYSKIKSGFIYFTTGTTKDEIVAQSYVLKAILNVVDLDEPYWKFLHCYVDRKQNAPLARAIAPTKAVSIVNGIIDKHYSPTEKEERYHMFEANDAAPGHVNPGIPMFISASRSDYPRGSYIEVWHNCCSYDLNGAYASCLIDIFPKCKEEFLDMFKHRHDNNNYYKSVFNFFVGCMTQNADKVARGAPKRKDLHPRTRFWIVQKVNELVGKGFAMVGGRIVYFNTDGIIVQGTKGIMPTGVLPGTWKLEHQGDVYVYRSGKGTPYTLIQEDDDMTGKILPLSLRSQIDLRKGKVVTFTRVREGDAFVPKNVEVATLTKFVDVYASDVIDNNQRELDTIGGLKHADSLF